MHDSAVPALHVFDAAVPVVHLRGRCATVARTLRVEMASEAVLIPGSQQATALGLALIIECCCLISVDKSNIYIGELLLFVLCRRGRNRLWRSNPYTLPFLRVRRIVCWHGHDLSV